MTRRDKKLDAMLNRKVKITFRDGEITRGILTYMDDYKDKKGEFKPGYYAVGNLMFRKSHVKNVIPIL